MRVTLLLAPPRFSTKVLRRDKEKAGKCSVFTHMAITNSIVNENLRPTLPATVPKVSHTVNWYVILVRFSFALCVWVPGKKPSLEATIRPTVPSGPL